MYDFHKKKSNQNEHIFQHQNFIRNQQNLIKTIKRKSKKEKENIPFPDNKKVYSAYITYSNETEAACAILCVDSLLIEGKIIRAFFGTTKYCSYFLNNQICQNSDKCMFLHQLQDEHINLAKKIIQYSNPKIRDLFLKKEKPKKIIFPFLDFIFESEEEKEHYFISGNISYVKSESKIQKKMLQKIYKRTKN